MVLLAAASRSGDQKAAHLPSPRTDVPKSFLFVATISAMVAGSTARSCTFYAADNGVVQTADERADGVLHALAEGDLAQVDWIAAETRQLLALRDDRPEHAGQLSEHYAAKLNLVALASPSRYRALSFDLALAPPQLKALTTRIESDLRSRPLTAAPVGLFARARRQLDFDPEVETLHATLSVEQLDSLRSLSELIAKETFLVRLGPLGKPGMLTANLRVQPGRATRVRAAGLVYLIQAYELRGERIPSCSWSGSIRGG